MLSVILLEIVLSFALIFSAIYFMGKRNKGHGTSILLHAVTSIFFSLVIFIGLSSVFAKKDLVQEVKREVTHLSCTVHTFQFCNTEPTILDQLKEVKPARETEKDIWEKDLSLKIAIRRLDYIQGQLDRLKEEFKVLEDRQKKAQAERKKVEFYRKPETYTREDLELLQEELELLKLRMR